MKKIFSIFAALTLSSGLFAMRLATERERDTVDIVSTSMKIFNYIEDDQSVEFKVMDIPEELGLDEFYVTTQNITSVEGTFSTADGTIYKYNTYGETFDGSYIDCQSAEVTVTTVENTTTLIGWMIGTDEKYYRLNWSYTYSTERDTVDIVSTSMMISNDIESEQYVEFGVNDIPEELGIWAFYVRTKNVTSVEGAFSTDDGTIDDYYTYAQPITGGYIDCQSAEVTVTIIGNTTTLIGWMIGTDEKYYRLNWSYTYSTERDTVDIVSTSMKIFNYIEDDQSVEFKVMDIPEELGLDEFYVTTQNITSVEGTFSTANGTIYAYNTYGETFDGSYIDCDSAEVTVTTVENTTTLIGWMIGTDEKYYRLNWSYTIPTKRDTVDIVSTSMTYKDYIDNEQAVQFIAGDDIQASGYSFFVVTTQNATSIEGTFDIYPDYCFTFLADETEVDFYEGQLTIASEEEVLRLTGWLIGEDEKYYRLNWSQSKNPTALPTINAKAKVNKFMHNGQFIIRSGEKNYNALGAEL